MLAPPSASGSRSGRIGPNAIIRTREAILAIEGKAAVTRILNDAGLGGYDGQDPADMVDEREVSALMQAVADAFDHGRASTIGWIGGQRTGDYLLANRIPATAQRMLRALPDSVAARALLSAISSHTWTFAGSAKVGFDWGNPLRVSIRGCPLCAGITSAAPCCAYYAATFERLFRELVDERTRVAETTCQATGAAACTFEIAISGRRSNAGS